MHVKFTSGGTTLMQERWLMKRIEYAQMIKQILNLAAFLPDQVLAMQWKDMDKTYGYVAVVLIIEICNFTDFTEKYNKVGEGGLFRLTATLNAYLGGIIEAMNFFEGDVFKFTGEKLLTQWKVKPHESLIEILHQVVCCALFMQKAFGKFETEVNIRLGMKMSISCGNTSFFVVGDRRKHFALVGDVVHEVSTALSACAEGEVAIPEGTWVHMPCERYEHHIQGKVVKITAVAYKANEGYTQIHQNEKLDELQKLINVHLEYRKWLHSDKKFKTHQTDAKIKYDFIQSMPIRTLVKRAPKNWRVDVLRNFVVRPVYEQIDEGQPVEYLTQLVEVSIQIIYITPSSYDETKIIHMLKEAFALVCDLTEKAGIVTKLVALNRYILIETVFGLKGYSKDAGHQNALKSGFQIKQILKDKWEIESISVGVTNSLVYSGVVGHPNRKEYTVISSGVNRAYELACKNHNKITCDYKTFKLSKLSSFYFKVLFEECDSEMVLEYNELWETPTNMYTVKHHIIGRGNEFQAICAVINRPEHIGDYYGICFGGLYKIGKTAILEDAIFKLSTKYSRITIAAIELMEPTKTIPYFCVSRIYQQLYDLLNSIKTQTPDYLLNLPNELFDIRVEVQDTPDEDIAMQKYRILNYFRDITSFVKNLVVIFIDNVEQIDLQSWEILEITLLDKNIRLIMAGSFEAYENWSFKFKLSLNEFIKYVELSPIDDKYVATISCQFLEVAGIPKKLTSLLVKSCGGRPGFLQTCLLRLVNNGSIELKLITQQEMDNDDAFYPKSFNHSDNKSAVVPVVFFTDKYEHFSVELTLELISMDVFDSFTPYEQLVIKTASVLGRHFTRSLLIIALKYPSEAALSKVIVKLFEDEVFECGSRFLYGNVIETSSNCCRCCFEKNYFDKVYERFLPKCAYCKILHFKDKGIREVAYNIIPVNQRTELHLICTDVLENMNHKCPYCLRNPLTNVFDIGKFKEIIKYCTNVSSVYKSVHESSKKITSSDIKIIIRETITRGKKIEKAKKITSSVYREFYDPKFCSCYEMLLRVYTDLIYHSGAAGHLLKTIFFTMQYAFLLIILKDFTNAILFLNKAEELCHTLPTNDNEEKTAMKIFKKLHVGKITVGLAKACVEMGQLKTAKNHLAIALRQYNIPSLALNYKYYRHFLTRTYLINRMRLKPTPYKDVIGRCDLGACLALCSKIFYLEGKLKMAKLTAAYSIYLIKTSNPNVEVLLEMYCTSSDIFGQCSDTHVCEKLVASLSKEIMSRYCSNYLYNLYYLNSLLNALFLQQYISGNINKAIRFGYRSIDISLTFFSTQRHFQIIGRLTLLLIYNFRLNEAVALCKLIRNFTMYEATRILIFKSYILQIYIRTNFSVKPIEEIVEYAREYLKHRPVVMGWDDYYFVALIRLHFLRTKNYFDALEFSFEYPFNKNNIKLEVVYKILLITVECNIYYYLRNKKMKTNTNSKHVKKLIRFMNKKVSMYKIFRPVVILLNAWWYMVRKWKILAYCCLNKAEKIADEQGNLLIKCYVHQLKKYWKDGHSFEYKPNLYDVNVAQLYSLEEWAGLLCPYPLDM